ncbi:MAG: DoxX family protein [Planctomycetota bacterium]
MAKKNLTVLIGRIVTTLVSALFAMSAVMKFGGGEELTKGMVHLGLPDSLVVPLGVLELSCVALYLIPATTLLGAILLTGYLGGAICTHLRVGDPFFVQVALGVAVWAGLWLRERRLHALMPLRKSSE